MLPMAGLLPAQQVPSAAATLAQQLSQQAQQAQQQQQLLQFQQYWYNVADANNNAAASGSKVDTNSQPK